MGICSFGQNKVVRHPVDHKHTSVSLCSLSMVSPPCIDGIGLLKGSLHLIIDMGELGVEKNVHFAGLQRCSDALSALSAISYTVFLLHVWVVCSPQRCSLLFDLTNFILRSLQCLIPALRKRGNLTLIKVFDIAGKKALRLFWISEKHLIYRASKVKLWDYDTEY